MNRIRIIMTFSFACAALLLTQCRKEIIEQPEGTLSGETIEVSLNVENGNSKATINGTTISWETGDRLYVVGETDGYLGYISAQNSGTTAYFTGTINKGTTAQYFHYYYFGDKTVAEVENNLDDDYYTYDISSQTGSITYIADNLLLMHGKSSETIVSGQTDLKDITMTSMISIVKLQFSIASRLSQSLGSKVICTGGYSGVKFDLKTGSLNPDNTSKYRRYIKNVNLTGADSPCYMVVIPGNQTLEFSQGVIGKSCTGPDGGFLPNMLYNENSPKSIVLDEMTYLPAIFTVNNGPDGEQGTVDDTQVKFSKGNLQYIGSASPAYWKFAAHQYDVLGTTTNQNSAETNVDRDLLGWGTSGYHQSNDTYNINFNPYSTASSNNPAHATNYYGYGPSTNVTPGGPSGMTQTAGNVSGSYYDWGIYNEIKVGSIPTTGWRTLTNSEWSYLFSRTNEGLLYGHSKVDGRNGLIVLPDEWTCPSGVTFTRGSSAWSNNYNLEQWLIMEKSGAVFLPAAGLREGTDVKNTNSCYYWSSIRNDVDSHKNAFYVDIYSEHVGVFGLQRYYGLSVRLVREREYDANGNANPFGPEPWE